MGNSQQKPVTSITNAPVGGNATISAESARALYEECSVPQYSHIKKKIGIGAIGVGARLRSILLDLLYTHIGLVELKAVSDESPEAIAIMKDKFFEFKFETFSDFNELLKMDGIDWVLIGSKNYLHRDHCVAAFRAGKHVFCEKPLAITLEQCEDIKQAHQESGKLFATGFVLRHAPLYQQIREYATDTANFGKIISVQACEDIPPDHGGYIMRNWRRYRAESGPHILEKCCHDIDLLLWIIGSLPVKVAAFGGTNIFVPENAPTERETQQRYKWWNFAWENVDAFESEKDIEDNIVIIMEFNNNVRVTFHANSNSALPQRRLSIYGTKAAVIGDLYSEQIQYQRVNPNHERVDKKMHVGGIHGGGDKRIVDDLAKCMEINKKPLASGQDALVSTIVCLAIDQARIEGKIVDLLPLWERFKIDPNRSLAEIDADALVPASTTPTAKTTETAPSVQPTNQPTNNNSNQQTTVETTAETTAETTPETTPETTSDQPTDNSKEIEID